MKNLILTLCTMLALSSCTKSTDSLVGQTQDLVSNILGKNASGYNLVMRHDKTCGTQGCGESFTFTADFSSQNIGNVSLNNKAFAYNSAKTNYTLDNITDSTLLGNSNNFYGITNIFKVNNIAYNFYAPKSIDPVIQNLVNGNYTRANGIRINWQPDAGNPNGKVGIVLDYIPDHWNNKKLFPNMQIWSKYYETTDAVGSFLIPISDLSNLPSGCMPMLHIGRLNEVQASNGLKFLSYTITHKVGVILQ